MSSLVRVISLCNDTLMIIFIIEQLAVQSFANHCFSSSSLSQCAASFCAICSSTLSFFYLFSPTPFVKTQCFVQSNLKLQDIFTLSDFQLAGLPCYVLFCFVFSSGKEEFRQKDDGSRQCIKAALSWHVRYYRFRHNPLQSQPTSVIFCFLLLLK